MTTYAIFQKSKIFLSWAQKTAFLKNAFFSNHSLDVVYFFFFICDVQEQAYTAERNGFKEIYDKNYLPNSHHSLLMLRSECCWLHTLIYEKKPWHTCRHAGALPWGLFTSTATSCQPPAASSWNILKGKIVIRNVLRANKYKWNIIHFP